MHRHIHSATIVAVFGHDPRVRLVIAVAFAFALGCGSTTTSLPTAPPPDETGFVDVPARRDANGPARMFYVFRKSDIAGAPLAVFFNGGPGYATSFGLLPYGTSPMTIDPATRSVVPNAARWTSFANLLFIDERMSGFSYGLAKTGACAFDPVADASDFVRVILHVLDAHAALTSAPVVLVGESYGGTRVTYALDLLLRSETEASRVDDALAGEIRAHFDLAKTTTAPSQFGRAVLLEPYLFGSAQIDAQQALITQDAYVGSPPPNSDPYDVRQPFGYTDGLGDSVANAFAAAGGSKQLLGASFDAIALLGPADRSGAFRTAATVNDSAAMSALSASMTASLGALGSDDAYVHGIATACADVSPVFTSADGALAELVAISPYVKMFVSRSRWDAAIYVPAIFDVLAKAGRQEVIDAMHVVPYDDSGHMIEVTEPQKLHDDVAAWLRTN